MKRLAKNFILATAAVSAIFFVDPSPTVAANLQHETTSEKFYSIETTRLPLRNLDFWSKFRDTVMPDKPQDNNPPKEMRKPKPAEKHRHKENKPQNKNPR
jgi:hypothetical protein